MVCRVCGKEKCENAHVKSRTEFKDSSRPDDHKNIIPLCFRHHRQYFDAEPNGKMAIILEEQKFLILISSNPIKIEERNVIGGRLDLKPEYVKWKNLRCSWLLKAKLMIRGVL